jgi:hypothetical protein
MIAMGCFISELIYVIECLIIKILLKMNKIEDKIKERYINNVISKLECNGKKHEVKLINRQKDLIKKYKKSQAIVREDKKLFEGIDLYIEGTTMLEKGANGLYENDIVGETDEQFLSETTKYDNIRNSKQACIQSEIKNMRRLIGIFFGDTCYKIKKEFINKLNIDNELVGYKNGNEVYYCKEFDCLYEIV